MEILWRESTNILVKKDSLMCLLGYNQISSNGRIETKPLQRFMFNIWFLIYHYYLLRFELIEITMAGCIAVKHTTTLKSGMIISSGRSNGVIYHRSLILKTGVN